MITSAGVNAVVMLHSWNDGDSFDQIDIIDDIQGAQMSLSRMVTSALAKVDQDLRDDMGEIPSLHFRLYEIEQGDDLDAETYNLFAVLVIQHCRRGARYLAIGLENFHELNIRRSSFEHRAEFFDFLGCAFVGNSLQVLRAHGWRPAQSRELTSWGITTSVV